MTVAERERSVHTAWSSLRDRWTKTRRGGPTASIPSFIVIGAMKCGTGSLYRYLAQHPQILHSRPKEAHFFDNSYTRGASWYRGHFPTPTDAAQQTFEASPSYIFHPQVPARIHQYDPTVKLILLLRDPVARAYSHYHHMLRNGHETLPFEDTIAAEEERLDGEEERIRQDPDYSSRPYIRFSYVTRGLYARQVRRWLELFPREQLLVIKTEALARNPGDSFDRIAAFLDLPTWRPEADQHYHVSTYPPMLDETRTQLRQRFEAPNRELAELLGDEFQW